MSKPTIVVIHGAHHVPAHFDVMNSYLKDAGYRVVAPPLPCTHSEKALDSIDPDVDAVRDVIIKELDSNDVVVFAHSYGGMVASSALPELAKADRGAAHGVSHVVYCAAMIPEKGRTVLNERPQDEAMVNAGQVPVVCSLFR